MPNLSHIQTNPDLITLNVHDLHASLSRVRDFALGIEGVSSLLAESLANSTQTKSHHSESSVLITLLSECLQDELADANRSIRACMPQGGKA